METIIGILALCAVMVGGAAWLLNRPGNGTGVPSKEDQILGMLSFVLVMQIIQNIMNL